MMNILSKTLISNTLKDISVNSDVKGKVGKEEQSISMQSLHKFPECKVYYFSFKCVFEGIK